MIQFVDILTTVLTVGIFLRAIVSWFPIDPNNPLMQILIQLTEPVLAPIRRIMPRIGMIDLTPMAAIILLQVLSSAVTRGIAT
ncbi:MAG: YggT family protein [Dehalococcoidia bacterium]|nr:YggT family protein [Dehalococcoidia bacterium]